MHYETSHLHSACLYSSMFASHDPIDIKVLGEQQACAETFLELMLTTMLNHRARTLLSCA